MVSLEGLGLSWGQGAGKQILQAAAEPGKDVERPRGITGLVVRRLSLGQGSPGGDL